MSPPIWTTNNAFKCKITTLVQWKVTTPNGILFKTTRMSLLTNTWTSLTHGSSRTSSCINDLDHYHHHFYLLHSTIFSYPYTPPSSCSVRPLHYRYFTTFFFFMSLTPSLKFTNNTDFYLTTSRGTLVPSLVSLSKNSIILELCFK